LNFSVHHLETLEILLDLDNISRETRDRQDVFFTSLSFNESATHVKLTCVLGGNFGDSEVRVLELQMKMNLL